MKNRFPGFIINWTAIPIPRKRFWQRIKDHDFGPQELGLNLLGIAVRGDLLYGSLYLANKVVEVNWKTGKVVRDFPVRRAAGLAFAKDGSLLVAAGQRVARVDLASDKVGTLVAGGRMSARGVATDADGRVYVSDCGPAMQVRVFDAEGKLLRNIGKAGGRPWVGRYDPLGMLRPAGLAVDAGGRL